MCFKPWAADRLPKSVPPPFGAAEKEYQEHEGAKDGSTLYVQYNFDDSNTGGDYDIFAAKLTSSGGHAWSTYMGGSMSTYIREAGNGIAVDSSGGVYVTGQTYSSGWVSGGFDTSHNGEIDTFVAKITVSLMGDADLSGYVDDDDLSILLATLLLGETSPPHPAPRATLSLKGEEFPMPPVAMAGRERGGPTATRSSPS
jgi:hypothetical protein